MKISLKQSLALVLSTLASCALHADTWAHPHKTNITSDNGLWQAEISPSQSQRDPDDFATAVLWSDSHRKEFDLTNTWMPMRTYVLNDGRIFTLDNWGRLGSGDNVAALFNRHGELLWKRSLDELIDQETRYGAMHTTSSMHWNQAPEEWSFDDAQTTFTLTLHNRNKLVIQLSEGTSETKLVDDLGNDPQKLLDRGQAFSRTMDYEDAEVHLKQAVELSPTLLEANIALARLYLRQKRYDDAVRAFEDVRTVFRDYPQRHNLANLYCKLAEAYHGLEEYGAEEAILRDAMELSTAYTYPLIMLAKNLEAQNRGDEIAALFQDFYERAQNDPYKSQWTLKDIGDYYAATGQHRIAIEWYQKVDEFEQGNNTLIYLQLAKSYEALGRDADALATYQRLIQEEAAAGRGASYIKQAKQHIERLSPHVEEP